MEFIAALPPDWHHRRGLSYPFILRYADGGEVVVLNYAQHHEIVKNLVTPQK